MNTSDRRIVGLVLALVLVLTVIFLGTTVAPSFFVDTNVEDAQSVARLPPLHCYEDADFVICNAGLNAGTGITYIFEGEGVGNTVYFPPYSSLTYRDFYLSYEIIYLVISRVPPD